MSELTVAHPPAEVTYIDPTGGRLVRWAEAASAAHKLAVALSKTAFVPKEMQNPDNATAAILMGDELGLSPTAALRSIYVVHGTPAMYARTMVALVQSHGHQVWTEETSDSKVTVCGRRRGGEHVERSTWTLERARRAGYTSNRKYESTPQEMLYAKAAAEVARKIAADTLAGVPYTVEDLELEQPTETVTVTRAPAKRTVARKRKPTPEPVEPDIPAAEPAPVDEATEPDEHEPRADGDLLSDAQLTKVNIVLRKNGYTDRDAALTIVSQMVGREITSTKTLTKSEAHHVIETFGTEPDDAPPDGGDAA